MASQSDARMYQELLERVTRIEELLTTIAEKVQQMAAAEQDLMPVVYPEGSKDAA
jgi:hypothetical protein